MLMLFAFFRSNSLFGLCCWILFLAWGPQLLCDAEIFSFSYGLLENLGNECLLCLCFSTLMSSFCLDIPVICDFVCTHDHVIISYSTLFSFSDN